MSALSAVLEDNDLLATILEHLVLVERAPTLQLASTLCKHWHAFAAPLKLRVLKKAAEAALSSLSAVSRVDAYAKVLGADLRFGLKVLPYQNASVLRTIATGATDDMIERSVRLIVGYENSTPVLLEGGGDLRTGQVVAYLSYLMLQGVPGPFMILCPTDACELWRASFQKIAPSVHVLVNQGSPQDRKLALQSAINVFRTPCDGRTHGPPLVIVTSYALAIKDSRQLAVLRKGIKCVIWDDHNELRRGWRKGSDTYKLWQHYEKDALWEHSVFLWPARVSDLASLEWLLAFAFSYWELSADKEVRALMYDHLGPLALGHAALSRQAASEVFLAWGRTVLDRLMRPSTEVSGG